VRAPLEGVLVADFSRVLAGPLATATLADLGATVVKVERRGVGDDTRQWGPPWTEANTSSYFECANRGKQSIELDLTDPADLDVALRLARRADVLVENFLDGTLSRFGLDHASLSTENPGLVHCSITGFGSHGGAGLPGYDFLVQAVGGLMSITGDADGVPTKAGVALVDVLASKDATTAILAALRVRDRTGRGQRVEVNLLSSLLGSMANQASSWLANGTAPARMGNRHPSIAPYETLRCRDGLVAVACGNDRQFAALSGALGAPALAADDRFRTNADRVTNRDALVDALEAALAADTPAAWVERLTAVGVPAGEVGDLGSGIALAERLGLEPVVDVGPGRPAQVRHPVTYSATPVTAYAAPPTLGQHNDDVRRWLDQLDDPTAIPASPEATKETA
jgi:crotonobetainyl-CoA:carnitine CoA-transferase CaiB-like acyl-CoA transferase